MSTTTDRDARDTQRRADQAKKDEQKLVQQIARCFNECQRSRAGHRKTALIMKKLQAASPEVFEREFFRLVKLVLPHYKEEETVKRIISFIIMFATGQHVQQGDEAQQNEDGTAGFDVRLLDFLMRYANADKGVRMRVCQLVSGVFAELDDDADISDELWDQIETQMCERSRDKVPKVRMHAVAALKRLQDPGDAQDCVLREIMRAMNSDTCPNVRKTALACISVSKVTLPRILRRLRDVHADVRRQVYTKMTELHMSGLRTKERLQLLECGLHDREPKVRAACERLLQCHWFESCCGGDPYALLTLLEVASDGAPESTVDEAVRCLLRHRSCHALELPRIVNAADGAAGDADSSEPTAVEISAEQALLWRVRLDEAKAQGRAGEEALDELRPDTTDFCCLLQHMNASQGASFTTKQLLLMAPHVDDKDEACRQRLITVLRGLLRSLDTPHENVPIIVELLTKLQSKGSASDPVTPFVEMLEDICEHKELEDAEKQFSAQGGDDTDEMELPESMQRWGRCLGIIHAVLKQTKKCLQSDVMGEALSYFVQAVNSCCPPVREEGLRCFGLYCLFDGAFAREHANYACEVAADEGEQTHVRVLALQILSDLMMVLPTMQAGSGIDADAIVRALDVCFVSDCIEVCCAAAEAFAKLVMLGRIEKTSVMARLVHLYFTPPEPAEDEECTKEMGDAVMRLQQALSVFFLAGAEEKNPLRPQFQRLIEKTALGVVRGADDVAQPAEKQLAERLQFLAQFLGSAEASATNVAADEVTEDETAANTTDSADADTESTEEATDDADTALGMDESAFASPDTWSAHARVAYEIGITVCRSPSGTRTEQMCRALQAFSFSSDVQVVIKALVFVFGRAVDRGRISEQCGLEEYPEHPKQPKHQEHQEQPKAVELRGARDIERKYGNQRVVGGDARPRCAVMRTAHSRLPFVINIGHYTLPGKRLNQRCLLH
eukprot:g2892.t1